MNSESVNLEHSDDPILDACLSEVLGGHAPPNLATRIVGADGKLIARTSDPLLASLPGAPPVVARPPMNDIPAEFVGGKIVKREWSIALVIAIAAGFVGVAATVGLVARLKSPQTQIAKAPAKKVTGPNAEDTVQQPVHSDTLVVAPPKTVSPVEPAAPPVQQPATVAVIPPTPHSIHVSESPQPAVSEPPAAIVQMPPLKRQSSTDNAVVSFIDDRFTHTWKEAGVRPTVEINDAEWCQRVFSRVLGRPATADELKTVADDKSASRREKAIRRLLTDEQYTGQFAKHWSGVLVQAFLGRGSSSIASREDLQKYFASALASDKTFSQIVTDLLTATGSPRPGADDYNPAVSFLLDGMTNDAAVPTARVARVLLGHQLQCAQCHEHPTQGWSQDQYWGLNACLQQLRVERSENTIRLRVGRIPSVSYQTLEGQSKTATPRFIDGSEITAAGNTRRGNLLAALAEKVVHSDDFCRATANRIWAQLFDYGFTRPLDDLGPNSTTAENEVLDRLAGEFAGHEFDLKSLIRWSVLSDPFSRSNKLTDLASKDMPEEGEPALFSRFYSRPNRPADALASLRQVARIRSSGSSEREMERARIDWLAPANRTATKASPKKAPVIDNPSILMKVADATQRPASGDPSGLVKKLAASAMTFDRKAEHLFLAALGRQPTQRESRAAKEMLQTAGGSQSIALDDLWWSLQNSSECIFDR
ncbi:MAG TPA: DUF1549 domain-containing protein [Pirellulaceae bacterium]